MLAQPPRAVATTAGADENKRGGGGLLTFNPQQPNLPSTEECDNITNPPSARRATEEDWASVWVYFLISPPTLCSPGWPCERIFGFRSVFSRVGAPS